MDITIWTNSELGAWTQNGAPRGRPKAWRPAGHRTGSVTGLGWNSGDGLGSMMHPGASLRFTTAAGSFSMADGAGFPVHATFVLFTHPRWWCLWEEEGT